MNYSKIADEINLMAIEDQRYRQINPIDREKIKIIDARNSARLKEIVDEVGCITISKFGEDAAKNAWLMVQHATKNLEFMEYYCRLMEDNFEDIHKKNWAYLKDRILAHQGEPQIYGTQLLMKKGETTFKFREIVDIKNVDIKRAEVGLSPLSEYIEAMREQEGDDNIQLPDGYVFKK